MSDGRVPVNHDNSEYCGRQRVITLFAVDFVDGNPYLHDQMESLLKWLIGALLVATAAAADHAGPTVRFSDGRSLPVDGVEKTGDIAFLTLESGGQIAMPAERILNWNDLDEISVPELERTAAREDEIGPSTVVDYGELIGHTAEFFDLDPNLLMAVVAVGSAFDPRAVSPRGACGLTQLMPETAQRLGVADIFDPSQNVEGGAQYLSSLLARYNGRTDLALAAYRSGAETVDRYRGVPPYQKTRRYVTRVLETASQASANTP